MSQLDYGTFFALLFKNEETSQQMNAMIRTYRNPIIVTILMVAAMGLWAWQRWQFELEYYEDRVRRHASGVFDTVEGTIQGLKQTGPLQRNQIEGILENVIRRSRFTLCCPGTGRKANPSGWKCARDFVFELQGGRKLCRKRTPPLEKGALAG